MILLDGKEVSTNIRQKLKEQIEKFPQRPKLIDIQIGHNDASDIYIKGKEKAANAIGIDFECLRYDEKTKEEEIIKTIKKLNTDKTVNGIFIQSPVADGFNEIKLINTVDPLKDVDGLTFLNAGKLINKDESLISCTPNGIIKMLKFYNIKISSKRVVIVGRSNLVGKPLTNLFINEDATVTLCHSKTINLKEITKEADILVVAIGKKQFITEDMIKENAIVIDVGINRHEGKIYGDVDFKNASLKASYITPVPGGVGPMTITMLLYNVVKAYKIQNKID
ncbi:MAG: tetrahydrofolate dehydrogenase/cyclohydrolase catalytic domain-containing protein [Bacilli bacterium]